MRGPVVGAVVDRLRRSDRPRSTDGRVEEPVYRTLLRDRRPWSALGYMLFSHQPAIPAARFLRWSLPEAEKKRAIARLLGEYDAELTFTDDTGTTWTIPAGDVILESVFAEGAYQGGEVEGLLAWLAEHGPGGRGWAVDVGANVGTTTLPLARGGLRVVAIEPMPGVYECLVRNVAGNGIDARCVQAAVSTAPGSVWMERRHGPGQGEVVAAGRTTGDVEVISRPLDDIVAAEGVAATDVAVVWSDTQGLEGEIVATGGALWDAQVPLFAELWPAALDRHGGSEAFVAQVSDRFDRFVRRDGLRARGARAEAEPIDRLRPLVDELAAADRYSDVLLLPR